MLDDAEQPRPSMSPEEARFRVIELLLEKFEWDMEESDQRATFYSLVDKLCGVVAPVKPS